MQVFQQHSQDSHVVSAIHSLYKSKAVCDSHHPPSQQSLGPTSISKCSSHFCETAASRVYPRAASACAAVALRMVVHSRGWGPSGWASWASRHWQHHLSTIGISIITSGQWSSKHNELLGYLNVVYPNADYGRSPRCALPILMPFHCVVCPPPPPHHHNPPGERKGM